MPSVTAALTASGNTELVAAPASGRIRVMGYQISGKASDLLVQLRSGTTTVVAQAYTPATGVGGIACPPVDRGEAYGDCAAGEALNGNLSGTGTVVVGVQYVVVG